jgi:hypothetical protein
MNQVRFQIGVPRVGSAARTAENEAKFDSTSGRIVRPEAGSAARAAEEEKKANGVQPAQTIAGFSLRGQNGMVTRNVSVTQGSLNKGGEQASPNEVAAQPARPAQPQSPEPLSSERRDSNPQQPLAGPLRLAASRFQTLVQSLFSPGDTAGKS